MGERPTFFPFLNYFEINYAFRILSILSTYNIMKNAKRPTRHPDPPLDPWHYQPQQQTTPHNSTGLPLCEHLAYAGSAHHKQQQAPSAKNHYASYLVKKCTKRQSDIENGSHYEGQIIKTRRRRQSYEMGMSQGGSNHKKNSTIDYVRKNQENIHSYSLISRQQMTLNPAQSNQKQQKPRTNSEFDNPTSHSGPLFKNIHRPNISTTYIGYLNQKPFIVPNFIKSRLRTNPRPMHSPAHPSRPIASEQSNFRPSNPANNRQDGSQFCDRANFVGSSCHVQKMLKIKQKLRQKLKRNSVKKDMQRSLYVKSSMRVMEGHEDLRAGECKFEIRHSQPYKNRSSVSVQQLSRSAHTAHNQKQTKQYLKMHYSQNRVKSKHRRHFHSRNLFSIVGDAINN